MSRLGALLHETHQSPSCTKVPGLDNMTTEKTVGAGAGGDREVGVGVCGKNLKKGCGSRQYSRGLHKITGLAFSANHV